jgi:hypothetical protein
VKGPVIERLARKHLLPKLGDAFVARRSLVYRRPAEHLLYGLSFDTSSFTSSRIFVEAFVQPLFVPADGPWYTFGFRLGDDFWDVDEDDPDPTFVAIADAAAREALPFFEQLDSLDRFSELIPKWAEADHKKLMDLQSLDDPVVSQAVGYAEILRGNKETGLKLLEQALESEREDEEYANEERIAEIERVLEAVNDQGLEAGQALLEEWRAQTIKNLHLEE